MRTNSTFPEKLLWSSLRAKQLGGLKFRRQVPIENFVVDFYCPAARLVVEVDGQSHDDQIQYDGDRSRRLNELGLRVVRVSNDDVLDNLEGVAEMLLREARPGVAGDTTVKASNPDSGHAPGSPPPPAPPPQTREGGKK